jgi:hypothetical protein
MRACFFLCLLMLGGLLTTCQPQQPTTSDLGAGPQWAATIADRLYERQVLSAAGRDELKRLIATHALSVNYDLPGSDLTYNSHRVVDPATVLSFCTTAFQNELIYRSGIGEETEISDLYIAGQVLDSASKRKQRQAQQRFAAALREAKGDTAAVFRRFASPGQLIEEKIPAEDSANNSGWTLYPPLGPGGLTPHRIADTRSVFGKTRTRTARDLYELGLLTKSDYAVLAKELADGALTSEIAVCQRAAELALDAAVYPVRRAVFDSLLTKLTQVGVLTPASRQRALADGQVAKRLDLFDALPYYAHARVLDLHALTREPARLYPQLLAEVATIWPTFRYTSAQVRAFEKKMGGDLIDQLVELSFTAAGRRYATTFTQGYRRKDGRDPDPATGARVSEDFVSGINQWLRDQGAAERLYVAHTPDARSVYGNDRLGLIVLTPAQRAVFGQNSYFLDSEDQVQPASQFTSEYIEQALALYQRLGLFAGLTATEVAEGRRQALGGKVGSYAELLQGFPHLLVATGGEDAEMPRAYAEALAKVAAVTRGAFRPTRVRDTFTGQEAKGQKSTLSFWCGSRHYQASFSSDLGWMDAGFTTLMERAVREQTHGGQLCLLLADESSVYMFLTAVQATALRQAQPTFFAVADEAAAPRTPQTLSEDLPF